MNYVFCECFSSKSTDEAKQKINKRWTRNNRAKAFDSHISSHQIWESFDNAVVVVYSTIKYNIIIIITIFYCRAAALFIMLRSIEIFRVLIWIVPLTMINV